MIIGTRGRLEYLRNSIGVDEGSISAETSSFFLSFGARQAYFER